MPRKLSKGFMLGNLGEIKIVIGKERLGMSSVSLQYARLFDGALKTEASANTLSYMLQEIMRPDFSTKGGSPP
jgi:hypothetical protein